MAGRQVLAQLGAADIILSGEPDVTYFLEQYKPQGLFATRVINVQFESEPQYGTDSTVTMPMNGDLITAMYARFDVNSPPGTAYYDSAGALMIERAELYIGNQLIERLWGEFINLVNEVEVPQGQQAGLANLIGGTAIGATNAPLGRYVVPLRFKCIERGLPVVPNINFRIILNNLSDFCSTLSPQIPMTFNLLTEYVFLSENERAHIQKRGSVIYLSENVQRARYIAPAGTSNVRCVTNFLHPVKELFFTVQNQNAIGFDYWLDSSNIAGPSYSLNFSNLNQLNSLAMYFNEAQRLDPIIGTNLLLGTAQFIENHTRVPARPFYMYSFSLDPESSRPSGAVNFGRIKHQYFDFFLAPHNPALAQNRVVTIWARYYQFLEVTGFTNMRVLFDNMDETGQSSFIV
jgi:hypothetical protein